jgi:hypothetical protein
MTIPSSDPESHPAGCAASTVDTPAPTRASEGAAVSGAAVSRSRARRLALHFGVVLLGASAIAAGVGGSRGGLSAAIGVALAGINLVLMQKITRALTAGGDGGGNAVWGLALPFKLVALVGVAYALVSAGVAQPVPLAMGFAILPLTGVFLPRPTSVPDRHPPPRARPPATRHGQPAA